MDFRTFDFSQKNVPLGDRTPYMEVMISAIEKFDRNLSWRAFFKLNPHLVSKSKETFGFNYTKAAPRLKNFICLSVIRFRKRSKPFLSSHKKEIKIIEQKKLLIIPADKTSNNHVVPIEKYEELVKKEINKKYCS
jgi:hypothetical protein